MMSFFKNVFSTKKEVAPAPKPRKQNLEKLKKGIVFQFNWKEENHAWVKISNTPSYVDINLFKLNGKLLECISIKKQPPEGKWQTHQKFSIDVKDENGNIFTISASGNAKVTTYPKK